MFLWLYGYCFYHCVTQCNLKRLRLWSNSSKSVRSIRMSPETFLHKYFNCFQLKSIRENYWNNPKELFELLLPCSCSRTVFAWKIIFHLHTVKSVWKLSEQKKYKTLFISRSVFSCLLGPKGDIKLLLFIELPQPLAKLS